MLWYDYEQTNSGGRWDYRADRGIGYHVWIEAADADAANDRAKLIGLYFDGVLVGRDSDDSGDRWGRVWDVDAMPAPPPPGNPNSDWSWARDDQFEAFVHPVSGPLYGTGNRRASTVDATNQQVQEG